MSKNRVLDEILARFANRRFARENNADAAVPLAADETAINFSKGSTKVELHWRLFSQKWRCDFPPETLPDNSRFPRHRWSLVRWLSDIGEFAPTFDAGGAARVHAVAAFTNTRRIVALALQLARDLLHADLGILDPRDFAPHRDVAGLAALVLRDILEGPGPGGKVDRIGAPSSIVLDSHERAQARQARLLTEIAYN